MSDKQSDYGEQRQSGGDRWSGFNERWKQKQLRDAPQSEQLFTCADPEGDWIAEQERVTTEEGTP